MSSRVAFVTGGTGGIGTAIVKRLADMGHKVATNYRNEEKGRAWQDKMKADGYDVAIVKAIISLAHSLRLAGITRDGTFHKMKAEQWTDVINTNLNSVFNVTRPVIEGMRDRKWGRVIQISSINGLKGQYGQANYAAAKAGMHGFTISLARENARNGVTVNTISPGYIATDMVMAVPEEVRAKIVADIPTGRLGTPEEIAYGVGFLADEQAGWITGSNLDINGGHHMGW